MVILLREEKKKKNITSRKIQEPFCLSVILEYCNLNQMYKGKVYKLLLIIFFIAILSHISHTLSSQASSRISSDSMDMVLFLSCNCVTSSSIPQLLKNSTLARSSTLRCFVAYSLQVYRYNTAGNENTAKELQQDKETPEALFQKIKKMDKNYN